MFLARLTEEGLVGTRGRLNIKAIQDIKCAQSGIKVRSPWANCLDSVVTGPCIVISKNYIPLHLNKYHTIPTHAHLIAGEQGSIHGDLVRQH